MAYYNSDSDTLTTLGGNPPLSLDQRALLLHECTHALIDVTTSDLNVTRHIDELASYIAQFVYREDLPDLLSGSNNAPWFKFYSDVFALVTRHNLNT